MEFAIELSRKSQTETKVGVACVRDDDEGGEQIISGGYNTVDLHAPMYTIFNSVRNGICLKDCDMYMTHFPCKECANSLIHVGVKSFQIKHVPNIFDDKVLEVYSLLKNVTFYKHPYAQLQKVGEDVHVDHFLAKVDSRHIVKTLQGCKVDDLLNDETNVAVFSKSEQTVGGVTYQPHPLPDILKSVKKNVQRFTNRKFSNVYLLKSDLKRENYGLVAGNVMVRLGPKNKFTVNEETNSTPPNRDAEFVWRNGSMIVIGESNTPSSKVRRCEAKEHSVGGTVYTLIFTST